MTIHKFQHLEIKIFETFIMDNEHKVMIHNFQMLKLKFLELLAW